MRTPPKGPRLDRAEIAERLVYARDWHVRMKPHFDALYGSRRCTGPICLGSH